MPSPKERLSIEREKRAKSHQIYQKADKSILTRKKQAYKGARQRER
jgi:hypothetical protein